MPHTLRADYQSLPQAQLCLYSSLIFRNSVATEPQSLLCSVLHLGSHLQVAIWSFQHSVQVIHDHTCMHRVFILYYFNSPHRSTTWSILHIDLYKCNINWLEIDCIDRNGVITSYRVLFQVQGGAVIPGEVNVMDRTFTASGLTPHKNYVFRVAGVNSNSTGPYSNEITVLTDEDGNYL